MSAAFTHARLVGATGRPVPRPATPRVAGPLLLGHAAGESRHFVGSGKIAYGKLSQALDYAP